MIDEDARYLRPTGLALAILIVSIVCLVASAIAVVGRTYLRLVNHVFGFDDALIIGGLALYTVDVALASYGATVGLGTRDADLNAYLSIEGKKYLMLWMMIYIIGLATIKSSICATLYRIASSNKLYRITVLTLLALTIATMLVTLIGVLLLCKPVSANWTGEGQCASMSSMVALSYTSTASTILTDLALAVLPGIMIWRTVMKTSQKMGIFVLLSFGSVASITTMIRAPFIQHYWTPLDNLNYWTGYIVLLSNIESAIGCITSSVPALRKLRHSVAHGGSSTPTPLRANHNLHPEHKSLVTFGSLPARNNTPSAMRFRNPTDQGVNFSSVHTSRDWTRLGDADSESTARDEEIEFGGIRAEYSYQVELTQLEANSGARDGR